MCRVVSALLCLPLPGRGRHEKPDAATPYGSSNGVGTIPTPRAGQTFGSTAKSLALVATALAASVALTVNLRETSVAAGSRSAL